MASMINISEAKAKLSAVIEEVVSTGKEYVIGKAGKPVVKIVRYEPAQKPRRLGTLKGKIHFEEGWDEWPEDIAKALGIID